MHPARVSQGGFHAIGDRAIATVLAGFGLAARSAVRAIRDARHRLEHVEIVDKQLIAGLVSFGVVASMQPAFDRLWGGEDGMYASRLGRGPVPRRNPFAVLAGAGGAGVRLGLAGHPVGPSAAALGATTRMAARDATASRTVARACAGTTRALAPAGSRCGAAGAAGGLPALLAEDRTRLTGAPDLPADGAAR